MLLATKACLRDLFVLGLLLGVFPVPWTHRFAGGAVLPGAVLEFPDFDPASDSNGDVNADTRIDVSDIVYLLVWQFGGGPAPATLRCERPGVENGDVNGDRKRDLSDAVFLMGWKFLGGPPPVAGCDLQLSEEVHADHAEDLDSIQYLDNPTLVQTADPIPDTFRDLLRPHPIYKLRIHAIRTANNDGSQAGTITPQQIRTLVDQANVVYYTAGIEFLFDPASDFEHKDSTVLNHHFTVLDDLTHFTDPDEEPPSDSVWNLAFKNAVADLHRGKIVVYFSYGGKFAFDEALGRWKVVASGGGSSSYFSHFVNMPTGMPEKNLLAHEVGHYLHNGHPFAGGITTVAEAAERIRKYVEDLGHSKDEGLDALDGDRDYITDTPPDAGGAVFEEAFGDKCGPDDTLEIPVNFADGDRTYFLQPNRHLIMSYFKGCHALGHWLSPQQISRTRDAVENGNRHHLVTLPPGQGFTLDRLGGVEAGAISAASLVRVGHRRLVSAVITAGRLKLIVWDVSEDGSTIARRGDALAGDVTLVSAVHVGLDQVATAVRLTDGRLKVILWRITPEGEVERRGSSVLGPVDQVSACRIGVRYLATCVRNGAGNLQVIVWQVFPDGTLEQKTSHEAGPVNEVSATTSGSFGVVTAVRDTSDALKILAWQISLDADTITLQGTASAGKVTSISNVHLDSEVLTTSVRLPSGILRVISWHVNDLGVIRRQSHSDGSAVNELSSVRMGTGHMVTACSGPGGNLVLDLWGCEEGGGSLEQKSTIAGDVASKPSVARAGTRELVTAVRNGSGNLQLDVWKVKPRLHAEAP